MVTSDSRLRPVSERWNGDRWGWWSLATGILAVPLTVLIAALIALLTGQRTVPLILLLLVIEILALSLVGSGMLDSITRNMNRGGLARDATEYVDDSERSGNAEDEDENSEIADRRTIRAGLLVLPLVAAFIYFMTRV